MQSALSAKGGTTWVRAVYPEPEDLAAIVREAALLPVDAEFVAQEYHRPEIAARDTYILILIHVPVFDRLARVTSGAALYLIIGRERLWTVQYGNIPVLERLGREFTDNADRREEYFSDGPLGLALYLVNEMYVSAFEKLERLAKYINIAEEAVFRGNERKMVEEIAVLERDVLDFEAVMRPQRHLFSKVPGHALIPPTWRGQWRRLSGVINNVLETVLGLSVKVSRLRQTNFTLLQHKENELLRILTYYSIFAIPVWIVLQPINPFSDGTPAWLLIMYWGFLGVLVALLLAILLWFKRKRVL